MSSEASDSADDGSTTLATSSNQDNDTTAANALISALNVLSPMSAISPIKTYQTNTQKNPQKKENLLLFMKLQMSFSLHAWMFHLQPVIKQFHQQVLILGMIL